MPSTLTVTNNQDSGAGSLRAALASAHHGDTITFASGLAGQTITLTSGELLIKQDVTIAGPSAGPMTISGQNASRVFETSVKTKPQVTLSGLTISDGYAPGPFGHSVDSGGGILNEGTLTVSNCTVSYNSAPEGAGILNDAGATLTISNSTLSHNTGREEGGSSQGGGIANYGTLAIHGSTLSYNYARDGGAILSITGAVTIDNQSVLSNNSAYVGGGIYGTVGTSRAWTLNDCTLSNNSAQFAGGAIGFLAGALNLNHCTLTGNSASPPPGQSLLSRGGAIYVSDGSTVAPTVTVSGCTLTGNSAVQGGGIYTYSSGYKPISVTVSGSQLNGNVASTSGGAIYMTSTGATSVSMTVSGCTLSGNTATSGNGGGIFNNSSGTLTVSNSTFGSPIDSLLANTPDDIFGPYVDGGGNSFFA